MMSTTESRTGFRIPWGGDAHRTDDPTANAAPADDASAAAEPVDAAWPVADSLDRAEGTGDGDPAVPDATAGDAVAIDPSPTSKATPAASAPPDAAPRGATRAKRDNPLVAGLVRAMREAAENARTEAATRLAASATGQVEAIHRSSGEEAEALRRRADEEILGIREWSKAEMARIREETERRIAHRRERLEAEVDAHAASVERRIDSVRTAVAEFETTMSSFFERLLAEDDPARLATLAEQMPEPPDLEGLAAADVPAPALDGLAPADAAAAEAEALAALDLEAEKDQEPEMPLEMSEDQLVAERLAVLTTPVRSPSPAGAETLTRVTVVGLVNIASISIFKRALAKLPDVATVSVTSGPDGDFVFAVTHGPRTDLTAAIPALSGFDARITGETDDGISVAARDPEA